MKTVIFYIGQNDVDGGCKATPGWIKCCIDVIAMLVDVLCCIYNIVDKMCVQNNLCQFLLMGCLMDTK